MKKILVCFFILFSGVERLIAQDQKLNQELQNFFFGLKFNTGIDSIKQQLRNNPDFKFYEDPNRDPTNSITGTIIKNVNLNPVSSRNQVVINFSGNEKKKHVSLKWSIEFRNEDLAQARVDWEKIKSEFKGFFEEIEERKKIGFHQEETNSLTLKKNSLEVAIRLIEYTNVSYTVSIEYSDLWKIPSRHLK